jgi:hypothetical protein
MFHIVILMLVYGTSLFCADAPSSIQNDPRISAFLQKHVNNPPDEYTLAAAAQTFKKDKFVLVFDKIDGELSHKFKVKIGSMQNLKEIALCRNICVMYSDLSQEETALQYVELELKEFFIFTTAKYLTINKTRNTGVLDELRWSCDNIINHNPEIPQDAWLTILK